MIKKIHFIKKRRYIGKEELCEYVRTGQLVIKLILLICRLWLFWGVALLALSPPKPSGLERCGKRQVLTKHPKWKIGGNFFEKKISKCPKNGEKSKKRRKKRVFSGYFPAYGGNRWNFLLLACNFWRQRFFNRWTFFEKTPHFAVNAG